MRSRDGDTSMRSSAASAVNNDGAAKVGFTAPSVDGPAHAVIEDALAVAGVEPGDIGYVEATAPGRRWATPSRSRR